MVTNRKRKSLELDEQQTGWLEEIAFSKSVPQSTIIRARMLLRYSRGEEIRKIAEREHVSRPTVHLCIQKALSGGISTAVRDLPRPGRPSSVSESDKEWVLHLARSQPSSHGYQRESWTLSQLTEHVVKTAGNAGHASMERASKYIIRNILRESAPTPHNVTFSRRIPEYSKTGVSLLVLSKQFEPAPQICCDEPLRSIMFPAADAMQPPAAAHSLNLRLTDFNTESGAAIGMLAGVDFSDGRVIASIQTNRQANPFVEFLRKVDGIYPSKWRIRIIPASLSAAASRENIKNLRHYPNRFEFDQVCKDQPWANFVDAFFTRMITAFLRSMHVESEIQFVQRLNRCLEEINLHAIGEMTSRPTNDLLSTA